MEVVPVSSKRRINIVKHGYDLADLDMEFFAQAVTVPARHDRFIAIGEFRGAVVTVVFALLGTEAIAPISMRPASRK